MGRLDRGVALVKQATSDRALLERIARRDESAATALFDRYAVELHGFLKRHAHSLDPEDLLQEVFVRALRGASSFRGQATARTWIYAIARYTIADRLRSRFEACTLTDSPARAPGPESLLLGAEERHRLLAALERLPDEQAIVLELHRVDGLSHREIGRMLGIRPATSRKRLERALKALRQELEVERDPRARHAHVEAWRHSLLRRILPEERP
jgi:RNA polymerase sigma-70 factor (ECF subfamily)